MNIRVVTVEDIEEIGDLLDVVLEHPDIEVFRADRGVDGLALVVELEPDLVLLDIMMPDVDGWVVYDTIRANPYLESTPVIILSVLPFPFERRQQFADSTIDFYVQKPFDVVRMRRMIMQVLGQPTLWDASTDSPAAHGKSAVDTS